MVVQERQGRAYREAVQPEGYLGKLHRHGVEVDAVHAPLEHVSLQKVNVREAAGVDRDPLPLHLSDDRLSGVLEILCYWIPWECPEEALAFSKNSVTYEVHCLNQEVP